MYLFEKEAPRWDTLWIVGYLLIIQGNKRKFSQVCRLKKNPVGIFHCFACLLTVYIMGWWLKCVDSRTTLLGFAIYCVNFMWVTSFGEWSHFLLYKMAYVRKYISTSSSFMELICELRTLTHHLPDCIHLFSRCFCCIAWQRHFDSQIFCLYSQVSLHSWMHIIWFSYKSFLKPNRGTGMPTLCHHCTSSFAVHLEKFLNSVCFYSKDSSNSLNTISWTIH